MASLTGKEPHYLAPQAIQQLHTQACVNVKDTSRAWQQSQNLVEKKFLREEQRIHQCGVEALEEMWQRHDTGKPNAKQIDPTPKRRPGHATDEDPDRQPGSFSSTFEAPGIEGLGRRVWDSIRSYMGTTQPPPSSGSRWRVSGHR